MFSKCLWTLKHILVQHGTFTANSPNCAYTVYFRSLRSDSDPSTLSSASVLQLELMHFKHCSQPAHILTGCRRRCRRAVLRQQLEATNDHIFQAQYMTVRQQQTDSYAHHKEQLSVAREEMNKTGSLTTFLCKNWCCTTWAPMPFWLRGQWH
jgi:hypothetical protein